VAHDHRVVRLQVVEYVHQVADQVVDVVVLDRVGRLDRP
jgi:hypothetical protein